jgi:hypothetical protein
MDIVLGALVLAALVALHLFMVVVAHRARIVGSEPVAPGPLRADDRTEALWQSGG